MAKYESALAALASYRAAVQTAAFNEFSARAAAAIPTAQAFTVTAFSTGGAMPAIATPLSNVHATGVGVRIRDGKIVKGEFVLKAYVFEKLKLGTAAPDLTKQFGDIDVDVEALPVQWAAMAAKKSAGPTARSPSHPKEAAAKPVASDAGIDAADGVPAATVSSVTPSNRGKLRPIPGGMSIAPLNARFVGTLGCFVRGISAGTEQIFVLSNNHVLADVNSLSIGTSMVQPGPESGMTSDDDIFASLSNFIPVQFSNTRFERLANNFDAAIARVTDLQKVRLGAMHGIDLYTRQLDAPLPGMSVTKSGRTTGVTTGTITAIHVNSVQVNYGTQGNPRIAIFDGVVQIQGDNGQPFSLPGDSGSVILDSTTGRPVALLFAGDGRSTTACDLGGVCRQFQVIPA